MKNAILLFLIAAIASASVLTDSAAVTKPGEWKELSIPSWNRDMDYLDVNGAFGSTAATDWSDNLVWVPSKKQIIYLGAGHLRAHKFIRYRESDNTFYGDPNIPACFKVGGYGCFTHGYDHQSFDPVANIYYYKSGNGLYTLDLNTETWSSTGVSMPGSWGTGTEFFEHVRYLVAYNGGGISVRHADSTVWHTISSTIAAGPYHNKAIYSVKHKKVYFGGGNNSGAFYSMDTLFNITRLADVPYGSIHVAYSCLTSDPVTGTPLLQTDLLNPGHGFYSYDTSANGWFPEAPLPFPAGTGRLLATPLPEHGVTFFMSPSYGGFRTFLYRFASAYDTLPLSGIEVLPASQSIELYLSAELKVVASYPGNLKDTTLRAVYTSMDTNIIRVSTTGIVTATGIGSSKVIVRKLNFKDTVDITVTASTALLDSITLNWQNFKFMKDETLSLHATGYFTKGSQHFTRLLDTVGVWTTGDNSIVSVNRGVCIGKSKGGPINVTVTLNSKSSSCSFTVMPRPQFIKRINFQVSETPFRYGWAAENGQNYSAGRGFGWQGATGLTSRDDRSSTNFLLKSFVVPNAQANFRISAPAGSYIIRVGMGDPTYGSLTSPNWTVLGQDTLVKHAGASNTIRDTRISVVGDSGLLLGVFGPINYLVLISDEGIEMNEVADDSVTGVPPVVITETDLAEESKEYLRMSPSPFNPSTCIRWSVSSGNQVLALALFDANGRKVAHFEKLSSSGELTWNASSLSSGVYFARLITKRGTLQQKALLLR
ncbi:MAG: T9SS type A sorting domain-containing protein [Fibrobacteres bacterium]|nr:T9SS type A sorting domain-containing protein [Fibrobacterota bacterium]